MEEAVAIPEPQVEKPSEWAATKLGFAADELQRRVLDTDGRRGILNCSRQWGKSTVSAAKAMHQAWTVEGSLTLVVSPTLRQSGEFLKKVETFARRLGVRPKGDGSNEVSLELENGSRIVGLPGTEATVRGFSAVALLLVDEASRVEDDMYLAIRPMLAVSNGALWLMSTPFGRRGFFYEAWAHGGETWERVRAPATECERISKKFLAEEERTMGKRWYRQEYLCEFEDTTSNVFSRDQLERALTGEVRPLEL